MKTLRSKLESILKRIYIESDTGTSSSSLMIGDSGVALFRILYLKHFENSLYDDKTISTIQALAESLVSSNDNSFCYGNSGTKWFFSYLYQLEIIEECDYNNICLGDELIVESALGLLETKNYEFLNGAVGLAQYLLFSNYKLNDSFFFKVFEKLKMFIIEDSIANSFNLKSQNVDIYRVNLGLAHGVIGVLKMCIQCTQAGICEEDSKLVAKKIIDFILKNTHQKGAVSIFPSFCSNDSKIEDSRLGWCYGDLIIGYILYQAAEIFDDYILLQHANNVLIETTYRRLPKETYVRDASICHGSIGIAHIYNKIWRLTNNLIYRNAAEFWIDYSLEKENYLQGENCFMKFNAYSNRYEKNLSLLEGSAGIGLALISFITEDYSWDHCLMLN